MESAASVAAAAPQRRYLQGPAIDALTLGGLSLIALVAVRTLVPQGADIYTISWTMYYLAFLVNFPHFLLSYQLLYGDHRKQLFRHPRYFWAAFIAPALIVGILAYGITAGRQDVLGRMAQAMFFLVGWHYIKQTYGMVIVTSALARVYYNSFEKALVRVSLYGVWSVSWVGANLGDGPAPFYGLTYHGLGLPGDAMTWAMNLTRVLGLLTLAVFVKKWAVDRKAPPPSTWAAYLAIYAWYLPGLGHPFYGYMIPLFHSLQYLPFVWKYKREEQAATGGDRSLKALVPYLVLSAVLGAAGFNWIPNGLDAILTYDRQLYGPTLALFCAQIFINIHHYFIDNVIWRAENPDVGRFIFGKQASQQSTQRTQRTQAA